MRVGVFVGFSCISIQKSLTVNLILKYRFVAATQTKIICINVHMYVCIFDGNPWFQ